MNNTLVMKKVNELAFQHLGNREQSSRFMMQIAIIRKAFGVKNDETGKPIADYERKVVLSDDEVRSEYNRYVGFLNWSIEKNDVDKQREFRNQLEYFIDGVKFFNKKLAEEFRTVVFV